MCSPIPVSVGEMQRVLLKRGTENGTENETEGKTEWNGKYAIRYT